MPAALRRRAPDLLVALVAAAVVAWRLDVPSPWRDEIATRVAAGRPLPDLVALTRTVDLVHLAYYLAAHVLLAVHDSITTLRWGSVLATAATAALLVALGRRLGSIRVGVTAGLLLAVSPLASRYGQEARPYALATLAATGAAYALVRATDPDAPAATSRRRWAAYAVAVGLTGLVNVLALLVLAGHAVFVTAARRGAWRAWALATAAALIALSPFLVATSRQSGQVSWLARPGLHDLGTVLAVPLGHGLAAVTVIALAVLPSALSPRAVDRPALTLGLGWALLPPVLLWLISQAHPLFDGRYAVAALPGVCLTLAALTIPRDQGKLVPATAVAVVVALAALGMPAQLRYRDASLGHEEDVRGVLRILSAGARPGDAVLFVPDHLRIVRFMTPESATSGPDDVALAADALASASLSGTDVTAAELPARLAGRDRVWLVTGSTGLAGASTETDRAKLALLTRDYVEVRREPVPQFAITLYELGP